MRIYILPVYNKMFLHLIVTLSLSLTSVTTEKWFYAFSVEEEARRIY